MVYPIDDEISNIPLGNNPELVVVDVDVVFEEYHSIYGWYYHYSCEHSRSYVVVSLFPLSRGRPCQYPLPSPKPHQIDHVTCHHRRVYPLLLLLLQYHSSDDLTWVLAMIVTDCDCSYYYCCWQWWFVMSLVYEYHCFLWWWSDRSFVYPFLGVVERTKLALSVWW